MSAPLVGYARCSTDQQDLTAQRDALLGLGVEADRIYVDHGLTGTNRERPGRREALAACRAGDTLVVTKLDRLARSLPDARAIADELTTRQVSLSLGGSAYDPTDAVGRLLFNVLAMAGSQTLTGSLPVGIGSTVRSSAPPTSRRWAAAHLPRGRRGRRHQQPLFVVRHVHARGPADLPGRLQQHIGQLPGRREMHRVQEDPHHGQRRSVVVEHDRDAYPLLSRPSHRATARPRAQHRDPGARSAARSGARGRRPRFRRPEPPPERGHHPDTHCVRRRTGPGPPTPR
jgi:hypothetical protein